MKVKVESKISDIILMDVLHTPELDSSLLSAAVIIDKGFEIRMRKDISAVIYDGDEIVATTSREGNLFRLNTLKSTTSVNMTQMIQAATEPITIWHYRLGHLGYQNIELLGKGLATGINLPQKSTISNIPTCEHCKFGAQTKLPSTYTQEPQTTNTLELIHTDICSLMNHTSKGGQNTLSYLSMTRQE